jgi:hypothetical protein
MPIRFRVDEAYLRNLAISYSPFAYDQDCTDFLESMKQIHNSDQIENPPYSRLNTVLTALAPTLTYPFMYQWNADTKQSERQMLVVGTDVARRPNPEQISDLTYEWGKQWGQSRFEQAIKNTGKDAYNRLLDKLQHPIQSWSETDAASLFLNLDSGIRLGYRAIPSVLASLFAGKKSTIHGKEICWRLAQDGYNGLGVVSNPFVARYQDPITKEEKEGTFAYKLEFRLQTQIGSPHRWIHLYIRCSRYVDSHLTSVNWRRDVTVQVGVDRPRLTGWGWSPTLVSLPVTGGASNPRWQDNLSQLLSAMKARDLISAEQVLQRPQDYRKAGPQSYDEYYVVHAEGFKPQHEVKTGFDFAELQEVANAVEEILGLELSCHQPLTSDTPVTQMYLDQLPLMMYDIGDIQTKKFAKKRPDQTKEDNEQQNRIKQQNIIIQGLRRAAEGKNIFLLLCWHDDITKITLEQEIRQALFLDTNEAWPDGIKLIVAPEPIPNELLEPLDSGSLDPMEHFKKNVPPIERRKFQQKWKAQMRRAFRDKTQAWEKYLRALLPDGSGTGLALIELRRLREFQPEKQSLHKSKQYHPTQNIKGAVRRAANKLGLASQMLFPIKQNKEGEISKANQSRSRNSVTDLIYRQTGLVYDAPVDLYTKAGLPQEQAEQLHVIALYKLHKNTPKMNYPMAIRLRPDGTFQALLPHNPHQWLPFLEAKKLIGEIFMRANEQDILLPPDVQAQFAAQIFTETRNEPTLVLLNAKDWRNYNVLPQFANTSTLKDQLDLKHVKAHERLYAPEDLPNLRIIRLRTMGTSGETPQYFTVAEREEGQLEEDKDLNHLTGFVDTQAESKFFHYLSIGRLPITAKQQRQKPGLFKTDEGGGIAFKHQTMVEFVPFFLQKGDDPQSWCHIPHFMRTSPAWDGGNIVLPYPMHMADCIINDQLCIIDNNINEDEF